MLCLKLLKTFWTYRYLFVFLVNSLNKQLKIIINKIHFLNPIKFVAKRNNYFSKSMVNLKQVVY